MTDKDLIEQCREAIRCYDAFEGHHTAIGAEDAAMRIKRAVNQYDQDFADAIATECNRVRRM